MPDFRDDTDDTQRSNDGVPSFGTMICGFSFDANSATIHYGTASAVDPDAELAWTCVDTEPLERRIGNDDLFSGAGANIEILPVVNDDPGRPKDGRYPSQSQLLLGWTSLDDEIALLDATILGDCASPDGDRREFSRRWDGFRDDEF